MHHACGINDTAYIEFKKFEYLREFEFISEKALAPKSGAQNGCFDEKKPRVENLVALSL
jgi:hypothetical protein